MYAIVTPESTFRLARGETPIARHGNGRAAPTAPVHGTIRAGTVRYPAARTRVDRAQSRRRTRATRRRLALSPCDLRDAPIRVGVMQPDRCARETPRSLTASFDH